MSRKTFWKNYVINVMRFFGLFFMAGAMMIAGKEMVDIFRDMMGTAEHTFHWEPWFGSIGVGSFGGLLWQTGKITAALETWAPLVLEFIRTMRPGGRRSTDPPAGEPVPMPVNLDDDGRPIPKNDHTGEEAP